MIQFSEISVVLTKLASFFVGST